VQIQTLIPLAGRPTSERAEELFQQHRQQVFKRTDRWFARLMLVQWLAGIVIAVTVSPRTWAGQSSSIHIHVWAAIFLGGAISSFPILLALTRPGAAFTRYTVAVAQMLFSGLLIHLTGGRIESHFHIFGSLAFLAFYRDWRVLIPATIVVALDHLVRGIFFPYSVYGVLTASPWRSLEHAAWVIFEDIFLVISCLSSVREMRLIAARQVELETTNELIEGKVIHRTAEVRASEERTRLIVATAHDAFIGMDAAGLITDWNPRAEATFGWSREEALGQPMHELIIPPKLRKMHVRGLKHFLATGEGPVLNKLVEVSALHRDGRELPIELMISPIRIGDSFIFSASLRDITERKQAERALRESEERFQIVSRATNDAIWDWDLVTNAVSFSESFSTLFGYGMDDFEPTRNFWLRAIHPDDHDPLMASVTEFLASGEEVWSGEYRFRCADGSYAFVFDRGYALRDESGNAVRMVGSMMNITERKHAERERQRLQQFQEAILNSIGRGVHGIDKTGHIIFENPASAKLLGCEPSELTGRPAHATMHHSHADGSVYPVEECPIYATLHDGEVRHATEETFWRADKTPFPVEFIVSPIRGSAEEINGAVVVFEDITERKKAETELRQAKETAETASRTKSEFLANMSHEIRTPMNGIIGMTDLALDTKLSREQREYLGMVKSSADSLLGLINDILDFSKIEAGKLELESISFSLRDCIAGMLKPLGVRADQKHLELVADITADVPDHLIGDSMRLRQILINLTDNAIKFTKRGEIIVKVSIEAQNDGESSLHFSVADTGVGIPADKQALIFEAFAQADGSTTRHYGGTGLGLAIATQLIQQMRGRIWVESELGKGTTFHFTARFGVRQTPIGLAKQIEPGNLDGLRVLIVDDNAINCRILREMLTNWRMNPTVVESGPAALEEMLRAAKADQPFPLILLDALMPGTDGFAVAEKIKEHPELASATVMMLSSAMLTSAVVRCDDLGVTGLLTKPVTQSDLLDAILLAISKAPNERRRASEEIPPLQLTSGLRILLAEDNVVNRAVATGILQKQGHTLLHAGNGREAVDVMKNQNVDLIFMDIQMPEMDGLNATRRIREMQRQSGQHTPIVAMTAHAMAGDRERCLAAGMDGYVSKPIKKEELIEANDNFTGNGYDAGRDNAAATPVSKAVFDREGMLEQLEGDEELFQKLIALFTENTPKILDEIRGSIADRNSRGLATAGHKLVGSLGAFRAGHTRDLAMHLEEQAGLGDFGEAQEIFTNLEREIDKIYDALGEFSGVET